MRFVIPALILASSAFLCALAVLANFLHVDQLHLPESANMRSALPDLLLKKLDRANPLDIAALIRVAAQKHRVPAALVKSIVKAESNFDCDAVSPKGAIGLMQLMPETAQEYGADPTVPEQNVDAGARYLYFLMHKYRKYGNSLSRVIAAYNAGPGNVDRYRGIPPFRETRGYVARVMTFMRQFQKEQG